MVGLILGWALLIYWYVLMARAIGSWLVMANNGRMPAALDGLWRVVCALTDPPLRFIGRYVKPVRIGSVAFDLAFLVLLIAVMVAQQIVARFIWF